jgi:hypothetical protein
VTHPMSDQISDSVHGHIGHLSINVRCPKCGREIRIPDINLGRADAIATLLYCVCQHPFLTFEWEKS